MNTQSFWLVLRNGEPIESFESRKESVVWLKKVLKVETEDFKNQDKTDEYYYDIRMARIEIKEIHRRSYSLGL